MHCFFSGCRVAHQVTANALHVPVHAVGQHAGMFQTIAELLSAVAHHNKGPCQLGVGSKGRVVDCTLLPGPSASTVHVFLGCPDAGSRHHWLPFVARF